MYGHRASNCEIIVRQWKNVRSPEKSDSCQELGGGAGTIINWSRLDLDGFLRDR